MASDDWERLQSIFDAAVALPEAERHDYLDTACADESALRRRVEALLRGAGDGTRAIEDAIGEAAVEAVRPGTTDLASGSNVGRYEIVALLGEGAMGHVYRARDSALDREVAVKLLNPTVLASGSGRRRFEREARAAAALKHRNIVTVHDVGEDDGRPFIVMELVDGQSLRDKMAAEPAQDEYLLWATQIAAALTAAHTAGIVHRDLKPENVIIDADNEAQIVDFGLARLEGAATKSVPEAQTLTHLTGAGMVMGTLGYMSPEAAAGQPTDHRTDQFALGAILYELVAGKRLYEGETPRELLEAALREAPPNLDDLPDLAPRLRAVIERCLAREPERRYRQTSELLEALRALATSQPRMPASAPALPKPRTEFIGRVAERQAIRRLFVDERVRLVTLTGPGGSGKTRLALQVTEDLLPDFRSRVFFVELGAIRDPALVLPSIARALGAAGDRAPIDAIRAELAIADAPTLVVLDNFEQVVSAARELGELLAKVENLTILVTSREVLRIYGEYDFPVEPLAFPHGASLPAVDELEGYPAVALFVARARAAKSSFELNEGNADSIVELCARLDGLPLALELAAARARTLTPRAMLKRLAAQKGLLTSGSRDMPARQQTLRATIDWSYELIDDAEKILFRRLSVFVGGFTLEAAEAVTDGYGDLEVDVIDGIASLVDKSLVQSVEGSDEDSRFILLETIREFSLDKLLEHQERDKMGKAHAAYFVLLAREGGADLARGQTANWLETFETEHDNCRAALDWLTGNDEAEWGLRLALGLFEFWDRTGRLIEGQRHYTKLLALEGSHEHKSLRARGLFSAAAAAATRGIQDEAMQLQQDALELYRELGDLRGQAVTLNAMGIACSTDFFDHPKARRAFTDALELWTRLGDDTGYARSLSNLAWLRKTEGEHKEARRMYRQAGELFGSSGNAIDAAWAVNHEADVAVESGDLEEASQLYQTALGLFENLGSRWGVATTLSDLAALASKKAEWVDSTRIARQALEMFADLGHKRGIARLFESLSVAALEIGKPETGLTLVACANGLREQLGVQLSGQERAALDSELARMRTTAGQELADSAWAEGTSRPVEDVVRLALEF